MAQQLINVGLVADDGTGDKLRDAFIKSNENFTELYGGGSSLALTDLSVTTSAASGGGTLTYDNTSGVFTFAPADLSAAASNPTFTVTNSGSSAYTFNGGGTNNDNNPTLYLQKGLTYEFAVNASGHPFEIRSAAGGAAYNDGVTNNATQSGTITFTVPMDAPDTLYYQCQIHAGMLGTISTASGGGGGGGSLPSRTTASGSSTSLVNDAQGNIDITGFKSYALMSITTDYAAWVRLYTTSAARTADAARLESTDPLPDAGVIAEVITSGAETIVFSPGVFGFNNDGTPADTIYARVKNKSGATYAIGVTLKLLQLES